MRVAIVCVVLLAMVGCVSEETKQLAQGVHLYQVQHGAVVKMLADHAKAGGALKDKDYDDILETQLSLEESTKSLSEILGAPKYPVEVE